jgi:sRNA-binding regulator protein Hfq
MNILQVIDVDGVIYDVTIDMSGKKYIYFIDGIKIEKVTKNNNIFTVILENGKTLYFENF